MPKKAAPSGFPNCRSVLLPGWLCSLSERLVFSRKSCVTAIPIDANASDVRSQARNVRSVNSMRQYIMRCHWPCIVCVPRARWSRATLPLFSSSID